MNCETSIKILTKLEQGKQANVDLTLSEQSQFQELIRGGYIANITSQGLEMEELSQFKQELAGIQAQILAARGSIARLRGIQSSIRLPAQKADLATREKELEGLLAKEKTCRTQILELSAKNANMAGCVKIGNESHIITFKGRELVEEVLARLARVKLMEVDAFARELRGMQDLFNSRAERAFKILKEISPKLRGIEEIHLRCAAIGLSLRKETPDAIATAYLAAIDLLTLSNVKSEYRAYVAECLIENAPNIPKDQVNLAVGDFVYLFKRCQKYTNVETDALNCALLLHPLHLSGEEQEITLQQTAAFAQSHLQGPQRAEVLIAPMILLTRSNGPQNAETVEKFDSIFRQFMEKNASLQDAAFAAALFAISKDPTDVLMGRYEAATDYFSRFADAPMVLPATMLALVSTDSVESFDTLRFAAAGISKAHLSLGGLENLSLAAKLLILSSIAARKEVVEEGKIESLKVMPKDGFLPPSIQILAFTILPIALTAFTALHAMTFHQTAVRDYFYHPVHTHYVYYHHYSHHSRYSHASFG